MHWLLTASLLLASAAAVEAAPPERFLWQDGNTVVFLGDSITEQTGSQGFVDTAKTLTTAIYPDRALTFINSGVGGERVQDMLDRAPALFKEYRTDWVVLFAGMNDVDADPSASHVDEFKTRYRALAQACKDAAHGNVLVMTIAVEEPLERRENKAVRIYSEAVRDIAADLDLRVASVDAAMFTTIRRGITKDSAFKLTRDGVHMNPVGATLIAATMLGAVGFSSGAVPLPADWRALQSAELARAHAVRRQTMDLFMHTLPDGDRNAMQGGVPLDVKTLTDLQRGLLNTYVNPLGYSSILADYHDVTQAGGTIRIYNRDRRRHVTLNLTGPDWSISETDATE